MPLSLLTHRRDRKAPTLLQGSEFTSFPQVCVLQVDSTGPAVPSSQAVATALQGH